MSVTLPAHIYADLQFAPAPDDRPFVFVNMIATIDGKILSGDRDESVGDLGTSADKQAMKRIEAAADTVMMGAQTLRSTPKTWNPQTPRRVVITASGDLPYDSAYLTKGEAFVATLGSTNIPSSNVSTLRQDSADVDLPLLLMQLRERGCTRLLVMGGSKLNAQLIEQNLVDEIFLTIAPKIRLGEDVPTIADGEPLRRDQIQQCALVEHHAVGDELFLRYRRLRPLQ